MDHSSSFIKQQLLYAVMNFGIFSVSTKCQHSSHNTCDKQ